MPNPTPKHPPVKLTKGYVDKVKPGPKDEFHWDAEIKGFGLRVNPSGKLTFIVQGRIEGTTPEPGFSEREEAEGRALRDALLAEVERIEREGG